MRAKDRVMLAIERATGCEKRLAIKAATAAIEALKYEDGTDETALIAATFKVDKRADPVSASEYYDSLLDEHLRA